LKPSSISILSPAADGETNCIPPIITEGDGDGLLEADGLNEGEEDGDLLGLAEGLSLALAIIYFLLFYAVVQVKNSLYYIIAVHCL
jgi:hypothetical protein